MRIRCSGNVIAEPLPNSGHLVLLIKNLLLNNRRCSVARFAAVT
jgi:hypothetical protein